MKICPECQTELKDDQNVCPNCGKFVPSSLSEPPHGFTATVTEEAAFVEPEPVTELLSLEENGNETFPEIPEPTTDEASVSPSEPEIPAEPAAEPAVPTPSVGSFLLTFILCAVPVIGFFYFFALAFGKTEYPAKKNYARAILVLALLAIAAGALFFSLNKGFSSWMVGQMDALGSFLSR